MTRKHGTVIVLIGAARLAAVLEVCFAVLVVADFTVFFGRDVRVNLASGEGERTGALLVGVSGKTRVVAMSYQRGIAQL